MTNRRKKITTEPASKARQMLLEKTTRQNSLEAVLLRDAPFREALDLFESLTWREQQLVMTRVRLREKAVSLKHLPIAMGIFAIFIGGGVTWAIRTPDLSPGRWTGVGVTAVVLVAALQWGMRISQTQDAHFNAWAEALNASHGLRTKAEEELWKRGSKPPGENGQQGSSAELQIAPRASAQEVTSKSTGDSGSMKVPGVETRKAIRKRGART